MGAVPLLRPDEEIDIAQRTEQAAEEVQRLLLKSLLAARPALWEGVRSKTDPSTVQPPDQPVSAGNDAPPSLTPRSGPISFASGKGAQAGQRPAVGQAPGHECSDQTARPPGQTTID